MSEQLERSKELRSNLLQLRSAYELVGVNNAIDLAAFYIKHDQDALKAGSWDYNNSDMMTNKINAILSRIKCSTLPRDTRGEVEYILWLWNHHATTCALSKGAKLEAAKFAHNALKHKSPDNPNKITELLHLMTSGRLNEAERWAELIEDSSERRTASDIIGRYKNLFAS